MKVHKEHVSTARLQALVARGIAVQKLEVRDSGSEITVHITGFGLEGEKPWKLAHTFALAFEGDAIGATIILADKCREKVAELTAARQHRPTG